MTACFKFTPPEFSRLRSCLVCVLLGLPGYFPAVTLSDFRSMPPSKSVLSPAYFRTTTEETSWSFRTLPRFFDSSSLSKLCTRDFLPKGDRVIATITTMMDFDPQVCTQAENNCVDFDPPRSRKACSEPPNVGTRTVEKGVGYRQWTFPSFTNHYNTAVETWLLPSSKPSPSAPHMNALFVVFPPSRPK